jgi:hypothetical protein
MGVPEKELLAAVRQVEQKVTGTEEEARILPKLDDLRTAIGDLSSHYDARLTEVKERNQQALDQLNKLAERLRRFSTARAESKKQDQSSAHEVSSTAASTVHPAELGEVQPELVGAELAEFQTQAGSPAAFWTPSELPTEFTTPGGPWEGDQWAPPARAPPTRPPPEARARGLSPDPSGFRTPSPEWSPRYSGSILRPYGRGWRSNTTLDGMEH